MDMLPRALNAELRKFSSAARHDQYGVANRGVWRCAGGGAFGLDRLPIDSLPGADLVHICPDRRYSTTTCCRILREGCGSTRVIATRWSCVREQPTAVPKVVDYDAAVPVEV
jgi:hypothetical protein